MNSFDRAMILATILRLTVTSAGLAFGYMGYKLLMEGVYERGAELRQMYNGYDLLIRQVGPGGFFLLFGLMILLSVPLRLRD